MPGARKEPCHAHYNNSDCHRHRRVVEVLVGDGVAGWQTERHLHPHKSSAIIKASCFRNSWASHTNNHSSNCHYDCIEIEVPIGNGMGCFVGR